MKTAALLGILALAPLLATGQDKSTPSPTQSTPNQKSDAKRDSGRPASERKDVDSSGKQQGGGGDKGEKSPTLLEVLNILFNGVLAVTAILGTIAIGRQLSLMRRQMTDAEESAKGARDVTERALGIAERQAAALSILAAANEVAVETARESMRLEQRAWVGVQRVSGELKANEPYTVTAFFANTGKTPALDVVTLIGIRLRESTEPVPLTFGDAPVIGPESRGILSPNQTDTATALAYNPDRTVALLNAPQVETISNGAYVLYVVFQIEYRDIFRRPHWVKYTWTYVPATKVYTPYSERIDDDQQREAQYPQPEGNVLT